MSMLSLGLVTDAVTDACGGMLTMLSSCGKFAGLIRRCSTQEQVQLNSSGRQQQITIALRPLEIEVAG
jgi:head-tail adaptor